MNILSASHEPPGPNSGELFFNQLVAFLQFDFETLSFVPFVLTPQNKIIVNAFQHHRDPELTVGEERQDNEHDIERRAFPLA